MFAVVVTRLSHYSSLIAGSFYGFQLVECDYIKFFFSFCWLNSSSSFCYYFFLKSIFVFNSKPKTKTFFKKKRFWIFFILHFPIWVDWMIFWIQQEMRWWAKKKETENEKEEKCIWIKNSRCLIYDIPPNVCRTFNANEKIRKIMWKNNFFLSKFINRIFCFLKKKSKRKK